MSNEAEKAKEEFQRNLRAEQEKLVAAFEAEHGMNPGSAMIEIGRMPNGRQTFRVRKMTDAEREVTAAGQAQRDAALLARKPKPVVYLPAKRGFFGRLFPTGLIVYLSDLGARKASADGKAVAVEVRA